MLSMLSLFWIVLGFWIFLGSVVVSYPTYVPKIVPHLYLFGKLKSLNAFQLKSDILLLPKSWFTHFYAVGVLFITPLLFLSVLTYCSTGRWPDIVQTGIDVVQYPATHESKGDPLSTLVALTLADIQVIRRLQECLFVSVYSSGKMSFIIYAVGMSFYTLLPVSFIAGTQFTKVVPLKDLLLHDLSWNHIVGVLLFIWASWKQRKTAYIFAKLRRDKSGAVDNVGHHIPSGDLFEYVSCPHYLLEILIYTSINIIYWWKNTMALSALVFVVSNQLISAHFTHKWYRRTFPKYPTHRKAIIPFIF